VLTLPAALLAVSASRGGAPRPASFALLGTATYVALEHLERLSQDGLPWLLGSPVFLLGLALQVPFALAAWWVARALLELEVPRPSRPPRLPTPWLGLAPFRVSLAMSPLPARPRVRGPPRLL
jgi:hypothetical protein